MASEAINTSADFGKWNAVGKEEQFLAEISTRLSGSFEPQNLVFLSDYFGSGQVGAFHVQGKYEATPAVLKVQVARPLRSEAWMIEQFARQNTSLVIQPPRVLAELPWSEAHGYGVLITAHEPGRKVLDQHRLHPPENIEQFFQLYQEYKDNCVQTPWLDRPTGKLTDALQKTREVALRVKPNSVHRHQGDQKLIERAFQKLEVVWDEVAPQFQHGHFSAQDLVWRGEQVVLFSQLFWKWKHPYADAVFGYHWLMYSLASVAEISPAQIEAERSLWLESIMALANHSAQGERLIRAALLERAAAGLLVDSLAYLPDDHPNAASAVESTREQLQALL